MLFVYWFRKDLRLHNNHALSEFLDKVSDDNRFLFLYIKNKNSYNYFGSKRVTFLLESLNDLKEEFEKLNLRLQIYEGESADTFKKILRRYNKISLYINEQVEPYCIKRDKEVKEIIESNNGTFNSFADSTIFNLSEIKNSSGEHYKVYTPFKNHALSYLSAKHYHNFEINFSSIKKTNEVSLENLDAFNLTDELKIHERSELIRGGRTKGLEYLKEFYDTGLQLYKSQRDLPAIKGTSRISAHIHFGTISIREALQAAIDKLQKTKKESQKIEINTWIEELLWREFYYNISFHFPYIVYRSFNSDFDNIKWNNDDTAFKKWCEGKTGYPIVDAGMRQLNKEGWMHNRVRMIVAMFLTKDLLIDWMLGEKYFAEHLIDLDFSNNNGGWQWSASTGVDAQPYFRIFNPVLQSKKFDPKGQYIKNYIPELNPLPVNFIHQPNLMSELEQNMYNVVIGKDYPFPIVDHAKARLKAIEAYQSVKQKS